MKNNNRETLLIIDSYALIFRSYFALERMQMRASKTNEPTWAVYGYFKTLFSIIEEMNPNYLIAAWDARGKTFREQIDSRYKQNRPPAPDDLPIQIKRVEDVLSVMKIPRIEQAGYEADDVIGTLARQASKKDITVKIVTLDKDLLQLIDENINVKLIRPFQGDMLLYDEQTFINKYGFGPLQLIDYKAIVGDPSDNYKGVKGIGDKGAKKLINSWETIENIYLNIDKVEPPRIQKLLSENRHQAEIAKQLATIECQIPNLTLDLKSAKYGMHLYSDVEEKFNELEFYSLIEKLPDNKNANLNVNNAKLINNEVLIINDQNIKEFFIKIENSKILALLPLIERDENNQDCLIGIGFSYGGDKEYYLSINQNNNNGEFDDGSIKILKKVVQKISNFDDITLVTHDAKKLITILESIVSLFLVNISFDTLLADYLLGFTNSTLDNLVIREVSSDIKTEENFFGKGKNKIVAKNKTLEELSSFIAFRASYLLVIRSNLIKSLTAIDLLDIFYEVDMPHLIVLAKMESEGVNVNISTLKQLSLKLNKRTLKIEKNIFDHAGHKFLISSPKQLASVLFEEMHLPKTKKNKTSWATDAQSLDQLSKIHPIISEIKEWRELMKIKTTYADSLPAQVSKITGKIHTVFSQSSTTTGRLTSNDPNLQNIPVRSELGREIRNAFISSSEEKNNLVSFDYSQIELRVLAHLSKDEALVQSFIDMRDVHTETAAKIYNISNLEVNQEQRRYAKVFNFGIIYGLSAHGLMQRQNITRDEAEELIANYFIAYPGVDAWRKQIIQDARESGFVETLLGRRRYIPNINAHNKNLQLAAERIAINMPVQGTAADIIKQAMNDIYKEMITLKNRGLKSKLLLQIHDELIFDVPDDEIDEITLLAHRLMPSMILDVPLIIERKMGKSWGAMSALD